MGVVISLVLVYFTKIYWIDAAVALFWFLYHLCRVQNCKKITQWNYGQADPDLLKAVVEVLTKTEKRMD